MTSRTAALVRCSRDTQTVDPQRLQIERWAAGAGLDGVVWYEEPSTSGAAKKRPQRDAMLQACRRGECKTLVVAALDRIGRNAAELVMILDELRTLGVRVVSLREGLDFSTTVGQMVGSVLAFVAQIERESLVSRTKAGLAVAKAEGRPAGNPAARWDAADDAALIDAIRAGESPESVAKQATLRVWRRLRVDAQGQPVRKGSGVQPVGYAEVPSAPGASTIRKRLKELGVDVRGEPVTI